MKYCVWDQDNSVMVCSTDSRREAFTDILTHLIETHFSWSPCPTMIPAEAVYGRKEREREHYYEFHPVFEVINQATAAYERINWFIPLD